MAFAPWLLLLPLGSAAFRAATLGSGVSNGTQGRGLLEAGLCGECDTYDMGTCLLCPNCKWRGGKCMHTCTACCAYTRGCTAEYCSCDGKTNAFRGMWKACGSQRKTKSYYFQMRVPQPQDPADRSKDRFIAMELRRSKADPQLILHFNQEWTVKIQREEDTCYYQSENHGPAGGGGPSLLEERSTGPAGRDGGSNASGSEPYGGGGLLETTRVVCPWSKTVSWEAIPAGPSADPRTEEVVRLEDAEHIRVFKAQLGGANVTALEIKPQKSSEPLTIYGGFYVPQFALMYAFDKFWPQADAAPPGNDGSGIYVAEPIVDSKPGRSRWDPPRKPIHVAHVRVSRMFEFLDRYLRDTGKKVGNKHRHAMMAAAIPGVLAAPVGAMTGALAGVTLLGALGPVAVPLIFAGFFGGAALPAAGMVWGTHRATKADSERETRLLASEKIFEKMRCHRLFQRCGGAAIVPARGKCPRAGGRAAGGGPEVGWESRRFE